MAPPRVAVFPKKVTPERNVREMLPLIMARPPPEPALFPVKVVLPMVAVTAALGM